MNEWPIIFAFILLGCKEKSTKENFETDTTLPEVKEKGKLFVWKA